MKKFQVDISDPDAIRLALEDVNLQVQTMREELTQLERVKSRLAILSAGLKTREGTDTIQQTIVTAVNERGMPTRAADVAQILSAKIERKTINWALWKSEREGLIKKLDTGVYASLDYTADQNELPVGSNGARAEAEDPLSRDSTSEDVGAL
jgi:hypothetical protein